MFRFTIRDVLWLTVVVALAIGWWLDQDQIRRERAALRDERQAFQAAMQRLRNLSLRRARGTLILAESELASMLEIKQRNPGAVSEIELRRYESKVNVARLDVEKARAQVDFGPLMSQPVQRL